MNVEEWARTATEEAAQNEMKRLEQERDNKVHFLEKVRESTRRESVIIGACEYLTTLINNLQGRGSLSSKYARTAGGVADNEFYGKRYASVMVAIMMEPHERETKVRKRQEGS